jgi:hypothetical protein
MSTTDKKPEKHDELVPDAVFRAELGGISKMTLSRYDNYPPDPDFPVKVVRGGRSHRFRSQIEKYKGKLLATAVRSQRQRVALRTRD